MKNGLNNALIFAFLIISFLSDAVPAHVLRVDSVTVDSVWNSDSSWYDGNGILQGVQPRRDCRISFIPQGEGIVRLFIALSIDSGKSWTPTPNPLTVFDNALASTFVAGQKATITVRVSGGDREYVAFKITARQAKPVIAGDPKVVQVVDTPAGAAASAGGSSAFSRSHRATRGAASTG